MILIVKYKPITMFKYIIKLCCSLCLPIGPTKRYAPKLCHQCTRNLSQQAKDARTRALISKIVRVDHAGELGADRIYAGQHAVLGNTPSGPLIKVCIQWKLSYPDLTYPDYSLIQTHVWEPIPISQQKLTHLSGNSVIRTVSLGTKVSG